MSTYSVAQVESITGISSHKLRIWERRYDFLLPKRTPSNIRYYTDYDLRMLINIGVLTRHGYRISTVGKLTNAEISDKVVALLNDTAGEDEDEIASLIISTINLDEELFNQVYQRQLIRNGFIKTVTNLFYPFLIRVGVLWSASKIIPAQEHFISNLIRQKIISAIDALPSAPSGAKKLVMFLFQGESHELSLLLASFMAKSVGWRVYYLGQNVPVDNVISTCEQSDIDLMVTMVTTPRVKDIDGLAKKLIESTGIPLVLSGIQNNINELLKLKGILYVKNPDEMMSLLKSKSV